MNELLDDHRHGNYPYIKYYYAILKFYFIYFSTRCRNVVAMQILLLFNMTLKIYSYQELPCYMIEVTILTTACRSSIHDKLFCFIVTLLLVLV